MVERACASFLIAAFSLGSLACGSDGASPSSSSGSAGTAAPEGGSPIAPVDAASPTADAADATVPIADASAAYGCTDGGASRCVAWNERAHCEPSPDGGTEVIETCPAGCFAGACSATECVDECALGASDGVHTCKLWDIASHGFIAADPAGKTDDRALDYDRLLRANNLPAGAVMNADYTDATRATIAFYDGYHDSAIWTGSALAAQAWRLLATGSPDAESQVEAIAATLHAGFTATGDPGYMARVVVPVASAPPLDVGNPCTDPEWHCNVTANGTTVNWLGATSRDQYTGVLLGEYVAYLATTNDATRKAIRDDTVTVATELMKSRTAVPATIVIDGVTLQKNLDLENVILAPSEMVGGKLSITLSTSDASDAHIAGMREFFPDYSVIVKQAIGIAVPIPRPSTAIMLGAIFQIAILTTDGVPGMEAQHAAFLAYYDAHASDWLNVADGWTFDANCGSGYFANHITFILAHVYAMLDASVFGPHIRDQILDGKLWAALKGHKNAYFAFLWGATRTTPTKADLDAAVAQLTEFDPGPRVRVARDVSTVASYMPHDAKCTAPILCDTATLAVDVKDRTVDDFLWQRQPWQLQSGANLAQVYPGVDYLAAYWAGRRFGFMPDDHPGTCARFDR